MRDKNRDQAARAGAKVARAKLVLALAERELNEAMANAMERPRLEPVLQKHCQEQRFTCFLIAVGNRKIS